VTPGWSMTSPVALLSEWQGPAARDNLRDLLLLGFSVNLPFLEKMAIRTARDLGARVTVIGDAAHGDYDPVDVRLRSYFSARAACRGAFHPKLALLIGERDIVAAIGSGNPTMAGWGRNDELWTILRSGPDGSAGGLRQLGSWLEELPQVAAMPAYAAELLREAGATLTALPADNADVRVLHNLNQPLLAQLPRGPVRELCLYAPFTDPTGKALSDVIEWLDPGRVVIGLQEHWTSYDGDAVLRAAGNRPTEIRLLPERYYRHGKLLEWETGGGRVALTGSANLTGSALASATDDGGNCELAVLTPVLTSQMPAGTVATTAQLQGRRTLSDFTPGPAVLLLGALLTRAGLAVTLARPYDADVTIEMSPDGSPGSWIAIRTVEVGRSEAVFTMPGPAGAVIRAVTFLAGQERAESPPVFTIDPARCARRQAADPRARLQHSYTEEEIFTDEDLARRFRTDLLRLTVATADERGRRPAAPAPAPAVPPRAEDRWAAYLEECERSIGRPLTAKLFGPLAQLMPGLSRGLGWSVPRDDPAGDDDDEPSAGASPVTMRIRPSERATWRNWIGRLVRTAATDKPPAPLALRVLAARIMIQLLAHGIWDPQDQSWRDLLTELAVHLSPAPAEEVPAQARQVAATLGALCMGLLRSGASLTGGTPTDRLAARTWKRVRPLVAEAEPYLADDLLIPPVHARAVVLNGSELEDTILLAMDDDPAAVVIAELVGQGWNIARNGPLYCVSGTFTNPVTVAARVATELGQHLDLALVHARAAGSWAFVAWRRPDLLLAHVPGNTWRYYRIDSPMATPASRFTGGEGLPATGMRGQPARLGQAPPPATQELLAAAGTDHITLLRHFTDTSEC
jgi:hypothetical protein